MSSSSAFTYESQTPPVHKHKKITLILVCLVQLLILFMYGFFSQFTTTSSTMYLDYIFTNLLAALGFGLLLCYFKFGLKQSLIITLFVVCLNVQLSPLLQKFWSNTFINGFKNTQNTSNVQFIADSGNNLVQLNFGFVRISAFCSISLLAALSSVIGRMGILSTIITIFIFNITYFLSYYLNLMLYNNKAPQLALFDDFHGSRVFMFASGFGLGLMLLYSKAKPVINRNIKDYPNEEHCLPLYMGIFVLLSCFFFMCDTVNSPANSLLNIFFALSASVMMSLGLSCLINGQIWLKDLAMSIFSGAIQISIIIKLIPHPWVAITIGAFGGLVGTFFMNFLDFRLNRRVIRDSQGLFTLYFLNSILAVFLVAPILIKAYNLKNNEDNGLSQDWNEGFPMVYASISLVIGLLSGIVAGLFRICISEEPVFSDLQFFGLEYDYGTKQHEAKPVTTQAKPRIQEQNSLPLKNNEQPSTQLPKHEESSSTINLF